MPLLKVGLIVPAVVVKAERFALLDKLAVVVVAIVAE